MPLQFFIELSAAVLFPSRKTDSNSWACKIDNLHVAVSEKGNEPILKIIAYITKQCNRPLQQKEIARHSPTTAQQVVLSSTRVHININFANLYNVVHIPAYLFLMPSVSLLRHLLADCSPFLFFLQWKKESCCSF